MAPGGAGQMVAGGAQRADVEAGGAAAAEQDVEQDAVSET